MGAVARGSAPLPARVIALKPWEHSTWVRNGRTPGLAPRKQQAFFLGQPGACQPAGVAPTREVLDARAPRGALLKAHGVAHILPQLHFLLEGHPARNRDGSLRQRHSAPLLDTN